MKRVLILAAFAPAGCAKTMPPAPPMVVVPADLDTTLAIVTQCEQLGGVVGNPYYIRVAADNLDANIVVAFVHAQNVSTYNGTVTRKTSTLSGRAARCPEQLVVNLEQAALLKEQEGKRK